MTADRLSDPLKLGAFELRLSQRQLLVAGKVADLGARAFDVLAALVAQQGQVVTKAELLAVVWPGVLVEENNLQVQISALRKILGAGAIATVPGRGYQLTIPLGHPEGAPAPASHEAAAPVAPLKPSQPLVAVLAFDNMSNDPDMQFFSDGVSEEILHTVAGVKGLKVIGKASTFRFRGTEKSAKHVGEALNATHVLDGSVRHSGTQLRIFAQLIDTANETALWSQRFDRNLSDIFALQDEIASAVAAALKIAFAPAAPAGRIDPVLYERFLQARAQLDRKYGGVAMLEAIPIYEEVVAGAPGFARAWGLLATARGHALRLFPDERPKNVTRASVVEAAQTALRLDPNCGAAYMALSGLEAFASYSAREALNSKALAVAPNDPEILMVCANLACRVGRAREAREHAIQAHHIAPLAAVTAFYSVAMLEFDGKHNESSKLWTDLTRRFPDVDYIWLGALSVASVYGDWDHFDAIVARLSARGPIGSAHRGVIMYGRAMQHPNPGFVSLLLERSRGELEKTGALDLRLLASIHALGATEEAFQLVDRATFASMFDPNGEPPAAWANPGFIFNQATNLAMMRDERFVRLCAKLGLCDYWVTSGRWPDCAADGVLPYDFVAHARREAAVSRRGVSY
ncbi:MAG: winged helix-turn-helix domain-containing protein [Micropepsaceae bacterium]